MCATIPIYFVYLAVAERVGGGRLVSIAAGALASLGAFALGITVIGLLPLTRATAVPFDALVCFAAAWLVRRWPDTAPHALGPKWSGLVAGFPVNSLPVMAILHFHYGARTIEPMVNL